MRSLKCIVILASFFLAKSASAEEEYEPSVDVTLRGGTVATSTIFVPFGYIIGLDGHYRVSPYLRAGSGVHFSHVESSAGEIYAYFDQRYSLIRLLSKMELHARPNATIDPFVGASLGMFYVTSATVRREERPGGVGIDAGLDAGIDIHIDKNAAFGLVMFVVVPLSNNEALFSDSFGGATYYSSLGARAPAPIFRVQGAF
jgi:hypothetical protein